MSTELTTQSVNMFQSMLENSFGDSGCRIDHNTGLFISPDASPEKLKEIGQTLLSVSAMNKQQRKLIDWYIGQLIVNHAAINDCSWSESISVLDLVKDTGREFKTLIKLPRMVSVLPDEVLRLPLTAGHLEAASSFAAPKHVDDLREFNAGRLELLRSAAENPEERNRTWLTEKMRELQREFKVETRHQQTPLNELRKSYEVCSQALLEWSDEDYDTFGVYPGELKDHWRGYRDELVERGVLSDDSTDPIAFSLPWRIKNEGAIEAEVLRDTEDDESPSTVGTV